MRTAAIFLLLSSAAAAQVTVTGVFRYEDRPYTGGGFTGSTALRPVRQAEVELLEGATSLAVSATDNTGAYSFPGVASGINVQVRVYARRAGGGINAVVRDNFGANAIYTAITSPIDTSVTSTFGTVDLLQGGAGPAFNIFDCAVKSFQHLAVLEPLLPPVPPLMILYWEPGSADGTYFDPAVNGIFLLGMASDPDEYDDDIILHEIGHWVATTFSKDDSLGGPHSVIDQLDPRTSWSEGWAHYWSATVRRFVGAEYFAPTLQVDNFSGSNSVFDIEGPSFANFAVMATNELAVAAALWDITDVGLPEFSDPLSGNEPEIWRTLSVQMPSRTNITLEDFHAGLGVEAPGIMAAVTGGTGGPGIFLWLAILYFEDLSEPNDSPGAAAFLPLDPVGISQRTLFDSLDEDWYSVNATPGVLRVETHTLGDGGDTALELYDATGTTLLGANDNRSFLDSSSRVDLFVPTTMTVLVRVIRSGTVVEYGYYNLRAEVVRAEPPTPHDYDHRCGAVGLEGLVLVALLRLRRRRC